ncbi:hypothetical protein [Aestuariivivens sediminicola]|uniref:hypothetical protein n=1 Tax=Aestuariivivens sediminicola TaxID=2913560 RepID=UPI001F5A9BD2|nr:hypothetical protein [Aestuariivivens sediminicola]
MKKTTSKPTFFSKLYCHIFGHDYHVSKKVTRHVKEYKCCHCKKELTTNSNGKLTELTSTFKEINDVLEFMYHKKISRIRHKMYSTPAA